MTSVSSGVSSSTSQQNNKLALLAKLFQTTGKSAEGGKTRSKEETAIAPPPPPPPHPAQTNSVAGLASMFEALQNDDTNSVSDLLSRLLQAVDTDGDGTISADELQAVTELTSADPSPNNIHTSVYTAIVKNGDTSAIGAASLGSGANGQIGQYSAVAAPGASAAGSLIETDQYNATMQDQTGATNSDLLMKAQGTATTSSAYEALFHSLQVVFAQAAGSASSNSGKRYTDALNSLAKAG